MQLTTFLIYPVLRVWAFQRQRFPNSVQKLVDYFGILSYLAYVITFGYIVTLLSVTINAGIASKMALLLEMTRFLMKTHAFIRSNVPRALLLRKKTDNEDKSGFIFPTFKQYLYFLFAPTLIYRDSYPRTKCIRWGFVFKCGIEVLGVIFFSSFLFERYIIPTFHDFATVEVKSSTAVFQIFGCMMPANLFCLGGFYLLLHAWLNGFAELLQFADRIFYLVSSKFVSRDK